VSSLRPDGGATFTSLTADPEGVASARPGLRMAPEPRSAAPRPGRFVRGRVRTLMAADLLAIQLALVGMYGLAEVVGPPAFIAPTWLIAALWPVVSIAWIVVFAAYRLYEGEARAIAPASFDEVGKTFHALLAGSLVLLVIGQGLEKTADLSVYTPLEALMFMSIALLLIPTFRGALRTWVLPAVMQPRRTIIVGAGPVGQLVRRKIQAHPEYGLDLVWFVDDRPKGEHQLGRISELTRLVDEREIDWVVIADSDAPYDDTLALLRAVRRPDVHLSIVPTYFELFASNATIEDIEGMPVVSLPPMRFSRTVRALKRSVDVLASGLGLLVVSPLLLVSALAIRLDSPGPVFFRQRRHGRGGREFEIVKFRTMRDGAEAERFALAEQNQMEGGGPLFKIHEDPRVTRVGRVLRKWSIDELPQLWNVLRGEMSLVGPRPFVVHESEQITGWAGRRLDTTPGITGLWQVLGRNDIPFEEMVKLDYIYVTNWSLWWDIKILCQTLPVVLARRGAY
jgi:exopolysaccharide biosynthesis polyprenyl glycosylphosphotransferase